MIYVIMVHIAVVIAALVLVNVIEARQPGVGIPADARKDQYDEEGCDRPHWPNPRPGRLDYASEFRYGIDHGD
jgi:hypothetical protein